MRVEVSRRAMRQWQQILIYYNETGGRRAAEKLYEKYLGRLKRILEYPESGFPEPLLKNRKIFYRAISINKYYKVIYSVEGDTLRIAAFWDMRMHPDKLRRRI